MAASVKNWRAAHNIPMLLHPTFLLDLAPADFFLFHKVKEALVGQSLGQESLKKTWEGVTRSITAEDAFTAAVWKVYSHRRRLRRKILRNKHASIYNHC
jgi:hypothetical protein